MFPFVVPTKAEPCTSQAEAEVSSDSDSDFACNCSYLYSFDILIPVCYLLLLFLVGTWKEMVGWIVDCMKNEDKDLATWHSHFVEY